MPQFDDLQWTNNAPVPATYEANQPRLIGHRRKTDGSDSFAYLSFAEELNVLNAQSVEPPLFVSYYTKDTPYEALANDLMRSLDKLSLPHRIEPIASTGSWVANTGLKSGFIAKAWYESDRPICWIDADAELLRTPGFLFGNPFDIAMVRRHGWYDMSGLVYLNKTKDAQQVLDAWVSLCQSNPEVWDQVLLTIAWYRTAQETELSSMFLNDAIFRFPRPWVRDLRDQLFYYPFKKKMQPFVDQKQASRALKDFVNASQIKRNEFGSDDITKSFRNALKQFDFSHDSEIASIFNLDTHTD